MAQIIKPKRGTATPTTGNLQDGEMCVDRLAKKLYIRDNLDIKEIGGIPDSVLTVEDGSGTVNPGPLIELKRNSTSPAIGDLLGSLYFYGKNTAAEDVVYSYMGSQIVAAGNGAETGRLYFGVISGGSNIQAMEIEADGTVQIPLVDIDGGTINGVSLSATALTLTNSFNASVSEITNLAGATYISTDTGGGLGTAAFTAFRVSNLDVKMIIRGDGNVGIGESVPYTGLHVSKDSAPNGIAQVVETDGTETFINFRGTNSGSTQVRLGMVTNALVAYTNSAERMRINAAGYVGIGTDNPQVPLHLEGPPGGAALMRLYDTDGTNQYLELQESSGGAVFIARNGTSNGPIQFRQFNGTTTSTRLSINSAGNVGIGTADPVATSSYRTLNITGGADAGGALRLSTTQDESGHLFNFNSAVYLSGDGTVFLSTGDPDSGAGIPLRTAYRIDRASALHRWYDPSDGSTERMRITSDGKLIVGASADTGATVAGTRIGAVGTFPNRSSSGAVTTGVFHWQFFNGNGLVGAISTSGTATAYVTSSDVRLKENIEYAASSGYAIDGIQVRQFDWKADGSHQRYGFIAQELEFVAPEAVTKGETDDDMWGVDYSKLVPLLVKEVQDLRARVASLESAQT
jgi:hypothetical protein